MTTEEFKALILTSASQAWLEKVKVTFNFPYINFNPTFTGITAIYEFANQQVSGWEKMQNLPAELTQSKTYFTNVKNCLVQFATQTTQSQNHLDYHWNNGNNNPSSVINNPLKYGKPLPYDRPEIEFLLKVRQETPQYFDGAFRFITYASNDGEIRFNSKDSFAGAVQAYEFTLKDHTEITQRRDAEKSSITKIRNDFQKYLSESEQQLINHLAEAKQNYAGHVQEMDALKTEKETAFNEWFAKIQNEEWAKWFKESVTKIAELERTYQEKLKLEAPATHWGTRAQKLKGQGWIALWITTGLVIIACTLLGLILWNAPEQIYASWFNNDKSAAIRWAIVYVTLISFIAYCIRSMTKVMFSSFHLARDCEERSTLTYFYLSLLKDSKVDDKDRQLIVQSLFSRAETGLLKDDSSPTMPNDIIKLQN